MINHWLCKQVYKIYKMWSELFSENISIALNAFIRLQKSRSKKYYNNHPLSINFKKKLDKI